ASKPIEFRGAQPPRWGPGDSVVPRRNGHSRAGPAGGHRNEPRTLRVPPPARTSVANHQPDVARLGRRHERPWLPEHLGPQLARPAVQVIADSRRAIADVDQPPAHPDHRWLVVADCQHRLPTPAGPVPAWLPRPSPATVGPG